MTQRYACMTALGLALALVWPLSLRAQEREPYTIDQLVRLVESRALSDSRILTLAERSCLGFFLDRRAEARLKEVGASESLIAELRGICVRLPRVVASVRVSPAQLELPVGAGRTLRAEALSPDSTSIPDIIFEWSSEDTTVVTVSTEGRVQGMAPGAARVTARLEDGPIAVATVRVTDAADSDAASSSAKSVGTAAALGVVVPGGGEFYTGNTAKGIVAFGGAAAALAVGYLTTTEKVLDSSSTAAPPSCVDGTCTLEVVTEDRVEETRNVVIGAVVAGAFWAVALVDGIRTAKRSGATAQRRTRSDVGAGMSLILAPSDGVRSTGRGALDITLVRVQW